MSFMISEAIAVVARWSIGPLPSFWECRRRLDQIRGKFHRIHAHHLRTHERAAHADGHFARDQDPVWTIPDG